MFRLHACLGLAALIALVGCPADDEPLPVDDDDAALDDDDAVVDDDDAVQVEDCDPALAFDVAELHAVSDAPDHVDLITLLQHASGGDGEYRFTLQTDASGAVLNELTGAYLPGEGLGVTDVVELTDTTCEGSATISIHVVPGLTVAPLDVEATPGTSFQFSVTGGSGSFHCEVADAESGGVNDTCAYSAGGGEGVDTIRIVDDRTGQTRVATIVVMADAALVPDPAFVAMPLGGTYDMRILGGSGWFDLTPDVQGVASYADGVFSADAPGRVEYAVADQFTGDTTAVTVEVLPSLSASFTRAGDGFIYGRVESPGDLNGDGFPDAIVSTPEADLTAYNSGAVFIHAGTADGLDPVPAREFTGEVWEEEMGWDFATGDFDQDGLTDLAIGSRRRHEGAGDNGAVLIFLGIQGGFFEPAPSTVLAGERSFDYFGRSVGACDFNGDGLLDLAVGASSDEDNTAQSVTGSQGGIHVFLGTANGFAPQADMIVWGVEPDGVGGWMNDGGQQLGLNLEVGDVTGDGLCDLIAGSWEYDLAGRPTNQGIVTVHPGVAADENTNGGVWPQPAAAITPTQTNQSGPQLGRSIAVGDVNNDGADDLVLGCMYFRDANQSSLRHGGVAVFESYDWAANPRTDFVDFETESDWLVTGDNSYDYFGHGLAIADTDGDGNNELFVGSMQDEVSGGLSATGALNVYTGAANAYPSTPAPLKLGGFGQYDWFGGRVATYPDVDGDGIQEILARSFRDDFHGPRVGATYLIGSSVLAEPASWDRMEQPGMPAGQFFGRALEVVPDVNGDGWDDLLVGVPRADFVENDRYNSGTVRLHFGSAAGFPVDHDIELKDFTGYGNDDQLGWDVSTAGDFNGDGIHDIAVVARYDDRPSSMSAYEGGCGSSYRSNVGAVYVFLGDGEGFAEGEPDFVYWGPDLYDTFDGVDGGFDWNGDGYDDLIIGGPSWDRTGKANVGGFAIIEGRAKEGTAPNAICTPLYEFRGEEANARVGRAVTGLGDLDGDGCDEVAVGAYLEDQGVTNQGTVRVVYGMGGPGCRTVVEASTYGSYDGNAYMGYSIDGGHDVDGDLVPDLVVGGYNLSSNGNGGVGAAWVVPGAWLNQTPPEAVFDDQPPTTVYPIVNLPGRWRIEGEVPVEYFGRSVAMVPGLDGNRAGIAVGSPHGARTGVPDSGGVRIHSFDTDPQNYGLKLVPTATIGGEDWASDSWLGMWLAAQPVGGRPIVAVGADRGDGASADVGSAYVVDLTP